MFVYLTLFYKRVCLEYLTFPWECIVLSKDAFKFTSWTQATSVLAERLQSAFASDDA